MKKTITSVLCGAVLFAMASTPQITDVVWTLDLNSLAAYREAVEGPGSRPNGLSLAFLDDRTIAVLAQFLFVPESGDPSARIQGTHINSVILTIDAQNGTNQKSRVWKGSSGSGIHSTGTSGCLVIQGNELLSLSQTLEAVARRELPLNGTELNGRPQQNQWTIVTDPRTYPKHDQWAILTDPRTKKALLVRFPFEPQTTSHKYGEAHWISPDTLEDQSSMSVPRWGGAATLVGDSVVFDELGAERQPALIQMNGGEPRPLCAECFGGVEASFGNGLVFLRGPNEYSVRDSKGTMLYSKKGIGGRADTIGGVRGAITRNRVAYHFGHLGRGLEETAVVLDMDAKKEIWRYSLHQSAVRTEVDGFVKESFPSPTLTMSPDGKKLAILSGTTLTVFEIP